MSAILVARDGGGTAERALDTQTRPPDTVVVVSAGTPLSRVVAGLPVADGSDWVWLLPADAEPEPETLARLLAAVEVAPSVVIAGPKLVDPDDRAMLRSFGESVTLYGATVPLAADELDQSQHDVDNDVLGVVLPGMLVRRTMWDLLGGPDRGLPTVDAGLDLSIRARLAGGRVVRVASARVAVAPGVQDFARRRPLSAAARHRAHRAAELHRRLAYAPGPAVPLHWLSLLPLALVRSLGLLLGKRPAAIPGEIAATLAAIFDRSVPIARASIRRSRRVGWAAIAPLRIPPDVVRERRASARDREHARSGLPDLVRAGFLPGGLAITVIGAVLGAVLAVRLVGESAITGGGLLPLASDPGTLWAGLGWGARDGVGLEGPADPFHAVLAVLGSLTPWNPSLSLVVLWVVALPLAALAAWWCATRLSTRTWPPVLAAALWMLAPSFLEALIEGRPAAVLVHVLLPWLLFAVLEAPRSWSAAGAAGLLFAAVAACAPVLVPVLLAAVVLWAVGHPRALIRVLAIPLPALVLAAPLVAAQLARGTPLGLLADPGIASPSSVPSGWHLLLGSPSAGVGGWAPFVEALGLPALIATPTSIALLAPLAAVVLLALFLPGAGRAVPAAILALGGLLTAVAAVHLAPATSGASAVTIWPGTGLSLYWAGLIAAVVVAMAALGRLAVGVGVAVVLSAALAVAPSLVTLGLGGGLVVAGDGRTLPAIVAAEAVGDPNLGTLVLRPLDDGSLAVSIDRGAGTTLDEISTFAATRPTPDDAQREVAELAGNLASRGGFDPAPVLDRLGIEFVVLTPAVGGGGDLVRERAAEALDAQPALEAVGDTGRGSLWRYPDHVPVAASNGSSPIGGLALAAQAAVVGFAVLLALPTGRRRRRAGPGVQHDLDDAHDEGFDSTSFDDDGFGDDRG
ncbi:glycosyltransferase [Pseudolysinimonas sp.]|uniref:glycosyltransferase n=1 Tax=Pseudolysinimonas sp. TaxID=2680009 RepID=UPI00286C3BAD|nr:glycosyltransferase [Pseudolysinimonas sp.]